MKLKFIGTSDNQFKHGKLYTILNIQLTEINKDNFIVLLVIDDNNKINCMPYASMERVNQNWEVVD